MEPEKPGAEEGTEKRPRPSRRRRIWRIAKWSLGILAGLTVLLVIAVWALLANLNHPAVKSRVISLVKSQSGLTIDYDRLEVSLWSGVKARSLSVASPEALAGHAPSFVTVEDLSVATSLWSLAFGDLEIDALSVGTIDVAMVADTDGRSTLSLLFPSQDKPEKKPKKKPTPLSHLVSTLPTLSVDEIFIGEVRGRFIEVSGDTLIRESSIASLSIQGSGHIGGSGLEGTSIVVKAAPARFEIRDAGGARFASAGIEIGVSSQSAGAIDIRADAQLEAQDILAEVAPIATLLGLGATISFDRTAGKTAVDISRLSLLDERATATLRVEVPDGEAFSATADGAIKLSMDTLPVVIPGLTLAALEGSVTARRLSWNAGAVAGAVDFDVALDSLGFDDARTVAMLETLRATGKGAFDGPEGSFDATMAVAAATGQSGGQRAAVKRLSLVARGALRDNGGEQMTDSTVALKLAELDASDAGSSLSARTVALDGGARGRLAELITGTISRLDATATVETLDARAPKSRLDATAIKASVAAQDVEQSTSPLGFSGRTTASLALARVQARGGADRLDARDLAARFELPLSLTGASGTVSLASATTGGQAVRGVELELALDDPFALLPGESGAGSAKVTGAVSRFRAGSTRGGLPGLRVLTRKTANGSYEIELDATGRSLVAMGKAMPGSLRVQAKGRGTIDARAFTLDADARGPGGATLDARAQGSLDARGRLRYDVSVAAAKLEAFAGALAEVAPRARSVALDGARLDIAAKGQLSGLVASRTGQVPRLAKNPLGSLRGKQSVDVDLAGLRYSEKAESSTEARRLEVPSLVAHLESEHRAGGAGRARLTVVSSEIELEAAGQEVRVVGLDETLDAKFERAPNSGVVELSSSLELASLAQSAFPEYAVSNLTVSSTIEVDRLKSVFLRSLVFDNPAAGTRLTASGALEQTGADPNIVAEAIPGREALTLEGQLTQKLAPMRTWGMAARAEGSMVVPFRIESGDLLSYRLVAKLIATRVSYVSKDKSLVINNLSGVIPLVEELAVLPRGIVVIPGPRTSALSRTRFFDVHPFLDSDDYITATSIEVAGQKLGPLAGNVRVARSVFSIDQMQVGYRGGQIAGRVQAAYREGNPIVRMRLNITGVRPTNKDDVLDANAALTFVPRSLELDGKVQVVRLSRSHLLELLSIIDPYHETVNVNKVRLGLKVGFPKFVRLRMRDGALDAKVELGGVAKVVRIDEIKAVPLGPIMQKYVAPIVSELLPRSISQRAFEERESVESQ